VDWIEGRIIRKRSKTADCENVPIVNYQLWPETLRLLKQERAADSTGLVLLNANGGPIWSEENTNEGKYKKNDNVKNAFSRLRKGLKIAKPLKSLKKTSATLIRGNERFSALASLFLGHAPQSMADKHYTQLPQDLLDQAIQWLGQELGIEVEPELNAAPAQ
jgi:integrase